jgi:hypothetical protein
VGRGGWYRGLERLGSGRIGGWLGMKGRGGRAWLGCGWECGCEWEECEGGGNRDKSLLERKGNNFVENCLELPGF